MNEKKHVSLCHRGFSDSKSLALYIHIPFCLQKCYYCDFYSQAVTDISGRGYNGKKNTEKSLDLAFLCRYLKALHQEIEKYGQLFTDLTVESIYLGGGTPSLLNPEQLTFLLRKIADNFARLHYEETAEACSRNFDTSRTDHYPVSPQNDLKDHTTKKEYRLLAEDNIVEITLEANPCTLNENKIRAYKAVGINRLSVGIQSFDDQELQVLGRLHDKKKAEKVVTVVDNYFDNYNLDLIFALPYRERNSKGIIDSWEKTLDRALDFSPPHLSLYNLQLEPGTVLAKKVARGQLKCVKEEIDARMYQLACQKLRQSGYEHYEISNFAHSGYQSWHNKVYWQYRPYLGLGPSAHSFSGQDRFFNVGILEKYYEMIAEKGVFPVEKHIILDRQDLMSEMMIMGLRLRKGVSRREFKRRFSVSMTDVYGSVIKDFCRQDLLEDDGQYVFLTDKGLLLGNKVFAGFLL